jgi:hypothetical protein
MKYAFIFALLLAIASCKKEKPVSPAQQDNSPQLAIKAGSYWVYDWYEIDSNGIDQKMNVTDSLAVVGDSSIGGIKYIALYGTYLGPPADRHFYIRDSSGYVISTYGPPYKNWIMFAYGHLGEIVKTRTDIADNRRDEFMTRDLSGKIIVPAGSFEVYDHQRKYSSLDGTPVSKCKPEWVFHTYYDKKTGMEILSQTAYVGTLEYQCKIVERRLVRYYIAP